MAALIWAWRQGDSLSIVWFTEGFALSVLATVFWSFIPVLTQSENPSVNELFPLIMLFLFLLVLGGVANKGRVDSLVYVTELLIFFRTLLFGLNRYQNAKIGLSRRYYFSVAALVMGIMASGGMLWSTFHPQNFEMSLGLRILDFMRLKGVFILAAVPVVPAMMHRHE